MFFDRLHGVIQIVLAAHREQDSTARKIKQGALQSLKSGAGIFRADLDARHSVFADDSAPERVVEIDHQTLGGAAG